MGALVPVMNFDRSGDVAHSSFICLQTHPIRCIAVASAATPICIPAVQSRRLHHSNTTNCAHPPTHVLGAGSELVMTLPLTGAAKV